VCGKLGISLSTVLNQGLEVCTFTNLSHTGRKQGSDIFKAWFFTEEHPTGHLYSLELKRFLCLLLMFSYFGCRKVWPLNFSEATATLPASTSKTAIKKDCIPNTAIQLNAFIQQNSILPCSTN